ncbi:hypothetical protein [Methanoregula sp.]|uniref:hypothetical protein n=1 Tax=Methanoregula sp. TaxID=2052170 RepID=UPI0025CC359C|nr:hypothetical protein [Methanoregula sp.]
MKLSKLFMMLICLSLICIASIPVVSAADSADSKIRVVQATAEQVEKINQLWGSDITIGDYMERVHPEQLVGVSDEVIKEMHQRKMHWPDENKMPAEQAQPDSILATLTVDGDLTIYSNRINFGSYASCSQSASYIYVESFLKNTADSTVGSTSGSTSGSYVSCSNNVAWPPTGYYHVHSWGYTITPSTEGSDHSASKYFSG